MKNKFQIAMTLAVILAMVFNSLALADGITADADALVLDTPHPNGVTTIQNGGTTASYDFSAAISNTGGSGNDVFPGSVSVTITMSGAWLSGGTSGPWTFTAYDVAQAGTIQIIVPCGSEETTETMTVDLQAGTSTNGKSLNPDSQHLSYVITAGPDDASCVQSNTVPEITVDQASVTVTEGDTANNTGTFYDADNDSVALSASVGDIVDNLDGTWSWSFGTTDGPAENQTVTITADDGQAQSSVTFDLTVNNADPVVTTSWASATVDCRKPATLNFGFSDPGVNDYPWNVNIGWGDGSLDTNYDTNTQGGQPDQTHTFNTTGTYTATVGVTDKDAGSGSATAVLDVLQTYTVKFLQPFDGSSPSNLITNTMKSGRVVPVKVTIYDDCAQAYVTDPSAAVKIFLSTGTSTGSSNDTVEVYADAGASNGNTLYFRWTSDATAPGGGFWIYNLDSRTALNGSAMVVGTTYRIDVFVGSVKATATTWALLKPVK